MDASLLINEFIMLLLGNTSRNNHHGDLTLEPLSVGHMRFTMSIHCNHHKAPVMVTSQCSDKMTVTWNKWMITFQFTVIVMTSVTICDLKMTWYRLALLLEKYIFISPVMYINLFWVLTELKIINQWLLFNFWKPT